MVKKIQTLYIFLLSSLVILLFASCRKDAPDLINPNTIEPQTYTEQFQTVWEGMNNSYVFWDVDTVDWEARYDECIHIFEEFDARGVNGTVTNDEYQQAWEKVFDGLMDHHLTAVFWNCRNQKLVFVHPGKNNYEHVNAFNAQVALLKAYPGMTGMVMNEDTKEGPKAYACLLPGKAETGKKIAYFRFQEFDYDESTTEAGLAPLYAFFGNDSNGITDDCYANRDDVEGIIIDVRGNGGGNVDNITTYFATLLQENTLIGYTRVKDGMGRLDYAPWMNLTINARPRQPKEAKPVVILSDINSVSCSELTTLLVKTMPNGTFIGERTHGGTGALLANPNYHKFFYDGAFGDMDLFNKLFYKKDIPSDKNFFAYYVYTSTYEMADTNYNVLEGKGIQPDIEVLYDGDALAAGTDTQLDRALEFFRTGK